MVVSEDMVAKMKAGAVIIDVSIDQGGCIETSEVTTHKNPTFKKRYGDYGRSGGTRPRFSALLLVAVVLFLAWFGYRKFLDMNLSQHDLREIPK